ncbi:MAG: AEC family transporter [Desulfocapsaceae bacterium]|nr:AEC family transporter [Desulfocapsaceae bacterium]
MIILNALFPVVVLIAMGVILKRYGFTDSVFLRTSDKLVYHIFFPVMLFYKIGGANFSSGMNWNFCFAALAALVVMFGLSIALIMLCKVPDFQAGSFAQSCYRFNTYIGVAVILNSLGEEGIKYFGILIGIAIPIINVAAVTMLSWYSQEGMFAKGRTKMVGRALLSNPLIIGCLVGILYSRTFSGYPQFIDNCLQLISMVTLPLALLSIGGALTFKGLHRHLGFSMLAALAKLLVFPVIGFWFLKVFGVNGTPFQVAMIFFALPTSTAIFVLSSQMQSDTELASSAILVSTLLSFPVLSVVFLL